MLKIAFRLVLKSGNIIWGMKTLVMFMITSKNAKLVNGLYLLEHKTQLLDQ